MIVLWDGHGVANDGQPYENSYAWFMRLEDGKVVDGTAFCDGSRSTICGAESSRSE